MGGKIQQRDVVNLLRTKADQQAYLDACIEEEHGDTVRIIQAIGHIARARGMTQLANETGLGRESLYKALSGRTSPRFDTLVKILRALQLRLSF
ncbi:hypothetical protein COMNV_00758 [Commensalibacter sp. Nvir]|uniref:addiction module antidote protein n=1 Tax=Commensalibacter sp. Nvir TaxID=3069817 RepID=UPI002D2E8A5F|nr:hypothetical protein COMNV_00758 [Commensalibacter sp. Nvir]